MKVKSVIPDLVSERSEAESVGNPCLNVEDARILSGMDTRRKRSHLICSHMRSPCRERGEGISFAVAPHDI
jgi:hypothetical protein